MHALFRYTSTEHEHMRFTSMLTALQGHSSPMWPEGERSTLLWCHHHEQRQRSSKELNLKDHVHL